MTKEQLDAIRARVDDGFPSSSLDTVLLLAEVERLNELFAAQNATMIDALCAETEAKAKVERLTAELAARPQYTFRGGYIEDESGDRWWSAGLLAKVEAERDAAFKRGVAAMREAAARWFMAGMFRLGGGESIANIIRSIPDPEDTP